jgi:geranylgeranyl diphosphate synthase type I
VHYLDVHRSTLETRLSEVVNEINLPPLRKSVQHSALSNGKRFRPLLTLISCESVGGDPEEAINFAVGIELIHTASLIIDDIIDSSTIRRNNTSSWVEFGHSDAVISSDSLIGEAFTLFSSNPLALECVSKAMEDLGSGEAMEIVSQPQNEAQYLDLARRKTGSLFRAAAELGGIAAKSDPSTINLLGRYAESLGMAFQIRDDVLDVTSNVLTLGKPIGQDAHLNRPSLLQVAGISPLEANSRAHLQANKALRILGEIETINGVSLDYLSELVNFAISRSY